MQEANYEGLPCFYLPDDLLNLVRPTQRRSADVFRCMSLSVLAENEKDFRAILKAAWNLDAIIQSDLGHCLEPGDKISECVAAWKSARREGAAKAGGEATAAKSEREFWEGFALIKDRWHLPSKEENASAPLLAEAKTSRNTAKSYLGYTREEWQRLPETKRNRILEKRYG